MLREYLTRFLSLLIAWGTCGGYNFPMERSHKALHVRRMLELIDARPGFRLSLRSVALEMGRNEAYLGRLFRQEIGMTMHEYVGRICLARAAGQIARGEKVEAVAMERGYRSKKNFYRQFSRRFGMTPGAFRRTA